MLRLGPIVHVVFIFLAMVGTHAYSQGRLSAEQAIFEEAARVSEIFSGERPMIFIGPESKIFFEALQFLSEKDALSPKQFALEHRIFWVEKPSDIPQLKTQIETHFEGEPDRHLENAVQILSSADARQFGVVEDCSANRASTKTWVLSSFPQKGDCVREFFLEFADSRWTDVTHRQLLNYALESNHEKFFALKRRVWRHLFLMLEKGENKDAVDTANLFMKSPRSLNESEISIRSMILDLREVIRRYFPKVLSHFDRDLGTCESPLAAH